MKIHVLPGDALAERFGGSGIEGRPVVCRECLIEGPTAAASLEDFWEARAAFLEKTYGGEAESYREKVVGEFEKLAGLPAGAEVNLWFEHELFCHANMWFCLYLLRDSAASAYRVAPRAGSGADPCWRGFGDESGAELRESLAGRVKFGESGVRLGADLWLAYQASDLEKLERLSEVQSPCFPHLREICRAAVEKNDRPKNALREIAAGGAKAFADVFREFSAKEGIYGYGDAQVERILRAI